MNFKYKINKYVSGVKIMKDQWRTLDGSWNSRLSQSIL